MTDRKISSNRLLMAMAFAGMFQYACQTQKPSPGTTQTPPANTASTSTPAVPAAPATGNTEAWVYEGVEFNMPRVKETSFPDYTVSITDFGAVGDGITKNTQAITKAIDAVVAAGGGKVLIPSGIWLTGPIILKSNINIHTEEGALVIFSTDREEYPVIETSFEGLDTYRCLSPIYGKDLENIAFTGKGVFDGSGHAWRAVNKSQLTEREWQKKVRSGGLVMEDRGPTWVPTENFKKGKLMSKTNVPELPAKEDYEAIKDFLRPVMVSLIGCKKVLLDGPTFQNSPAWNIHPLMCEDVIIRNLTVKNPEYAHNGDGIDLESCRSVLIYNNRFDVGDDAICFKSGKDIDGRRRGMPTENVVVKNNVVYHGHGGFVIGSEMSGGVRNVHVSNCTFIGTDVGLRFKSTRGRGGVVENIWISNINMINIPTEAIRFNMFYGGTPPRLDEGAAVAERTEEAVPVTEETPSFRNIYMKNITATGTETAAFFQGLPEMNLQNVSLENAVLEARNGITLIDADGIKLKNVKVLAEKGAALTIYNSRNVEVSGLAYHQNQDSTSVVRVLGELTQNVQLQRSNFKNAARQVQQAKNLQQGVSWQ
ncbi:glycoside hydrolase family 28 protein [Cesiribacter sp. SM1]|uniref:glycoside hydrolase family 28 protein n=1 Tax=Cesiribacter sp. SM1 TaxID=2861196 RepID=UPI001CD78299|nr:glycoside hydrolase family 28 protein [Cesiribacter sp. SM1]